MKPNVNQNDTADDAISPGSFNNYQVENAIPVNIVSTEKIEIELETDFTIEIDPSVLKRRDFIVFVLHKHKHFQAAEMVQYLATVLNQNVEVILSDIQALRTIQTFKAHKRRVNEQLIQKVRMKQHLKAQCSEAVYNKMDNAVSFDSDMIVSLSLRYNQMPKQIYNDILSYKRVATQVARYRSNNKKLALIRLNLPNAPKM